MEPIEDKEFDPKRNPAQKDPANKRNTNVLVVSLILVVIAFVGMMYYWSTDPSMPGSSAPTGSQPASDSTTN
ncbi:MAG: hypothetical protein AAFV26_03145 [Pseudomonadota bacterium]